MTASNQAPQSADKPMCPTCHTGHFVVRCHLHRQTFWFSCTICGWAGDPVTLDAPVPLGQKP